MCFQNDASEWDPDRVVHRRPVIYLSDHRVISVAIRLLYGGEYNAITLKRLHIILLNNNTLYRALNQNSIVHTSLSLSSKHFYHLDRRHFHDSKNILTWFDRISIDTLSAAFAHQRDERVGLRSVAATRSSFVITEASFDTGNACIRSMLHIMYLIWPYVDGRIEHWRIKTVETEDEPFQARIKLL